MRVVMLLLPLLVSAAANAQTPPAKDPNKPICKTQVATGELAKRTRECHTSAEWQRLSEDGRKDAEHYRDVMNSSRGGN